MKKDTFCKTCGIKITQHNRHGRTRKFCNFTCKNKYRNLHNKEIKICRSCGYEYIYGGKIFCKKCCSTGRRDDYIVKNSRMINKKRICKNCGKEYFLEGKTTFCSEDCQKEAVIKKQKERNKKYGYRYRAKRLDNHKKNPKKQKARDAVSIALKNGQLIKPNKCEICGHENIAIKAHHEDYDKPFYIKWVCDSCHNKIHWAERKIMKLKAI